MTWEPISLAYAKAEPAQPPDLEDLLYRGKRHYVSGPPEVAKTLAFYALALAEVRRGGTAALFDFEMGLAGALRLLRDLGAGDDDLARLLYFEPETPATEASMAELAERWKPTLVVTDAAAGAYELQGLDDNKRSDCEKWSRIFVRPFWHRGVTTAVLDHVTKNAENRGRFAIGSERKIGSADVHFGFEVVTPLQRGGNGRIRVVTHRDRPGHLARPCAATLELASDPTTHAITWHFAPPTDEASVEDFWRPTVLMERISRYLDAQSDEVTRSAIYRSVRGKRDYLVTAIDYLVEDGYVTERGGNRGSRLMRLVKPFPDPSPRVPDPSPGAETTTRSPFPPSLERGTGDGSSVDATDDLDPGARLDALVERSAP